MEKLANYKYTPQTESPKIRLINYLSEKHSLDPKKKANPNQEVSAPVKKRKFSFGFLKVKNREFNFGDINQISVDKAQREKAEKDRLNGKCENDNDSLSQNASAGLESPIVKNGKIIDHEIANVFSLSNFRHSPFMLSFEDDSVEREFYRTMWFPGWFKCTRLIIVILMVACVVEIGLLMLFYRFVSPVMGAIIMVSAMFLVMLIILGLSFVKWEKMLGRRNTTWPLVVCEVAYVIIVFIGIIMVTTAVQLWVVNCNYEVSQHFKIFVSIDSYFLFIFLMFIRVRIKIHTLVMQVLIFISFGTSVIVKNAIIARWDIFMYEFLICLVASVGCLYTNYLHETQIRKSFIIEKKLTLLKKTLKEKVEIRNILLKSNVPNRFVRGLIRRRTFKKIVLITVKFPDLVFQKNRRSFMFIVEFLEAAFREFSSTAKNFGFDLLNVSKDHFRCFFVVDRSRKTEKEICLDALNISSLFINSLDLVNAKTECNFKIKIAVTLNKGTFSPVGIIQMLSYDLFGEVFRENEIVHEKVEKQSGIFVTDKVFRCVKQLFRFEMIVGDDDDSMIHELISTDLSYFDHEYISSIDKDLTSSEEEQEKSQQHVRVCPSQENTKEVKMMVVQKKPSFIDNEKKLELFRVKNGVLSGFIVALFSNIVHVFFLVTFVINFSTGFFTKELGLSITVISCILLTFAAFVVVLLFFAYSRSWAVQLRVGYICSLLVHLFVLVVTMTYYFIGGALTVEYFRYVFIIYCIFWAIVTAIHPIFSISVFIFSIVTNIVVQLIIQWKDTRFEFIIHELIFDIIVVVVVVYLIVRQEVIVRSTFNKIQDLCGHVRCVRNEIKSVNKFLKVKIPKVLLTSYKCGDKWGCARLQATVVYLEVSGWDKLYICDRKTAFEFLNDGFEMINSNLRKNKELKRACVSRNVFVVYCQILESSIDEIHKLLTFVEGCIDNVFKLNNCYSTFEKGCVCRLRAEVFHGEFNSTLLGNEKFVFEIFPTSGTNIRGKTKMKCLSGVHDGKEGYIWVCPRTLRIMKARGSCFCKNE